MRFEIGDLVAFDDLLYTWKDGSPIIGVIVGKWEKTPEPIARPNETEVYWKIQIGDKTIHLEEHMFRRVT